MQAPAEIVSPKMGFGRFGDWQERSALVLLLVMHCLPSFSVSRYVASVTLTDQHRLHVKLSAAKLPALSAIDQTARSIVERLARPSQRRQTRRTSARLRRRHRVPAGGSPEGGSLRAGGLRSTRNDVPGMRCRWPEACQVRRDGVLSLPVALGPEFSRGPVRRTSGAGGGRPFALDAWGRQPDRD